MAIPEDIGLNDIQASIFSLLNKLRPHLHAINPQRNHIQSRRKRSELEARSVIYSRTRTESYHGLLGFQFFFYFFYFYFFIKLNINTYVFLDLKTRFGLHQK
jgi:hypothetical protein